MEQCDRVEDLMVYSSSSGGSGSGLYSYFLDKAEQELKKTQTVSFSLVPPINRYGTDPVSHLNNMLVMKDKTEKLKGIDIFVDNFQIGKIL